MNCDGKYLYLEWHDFDYAVEQIAECIISSMAMRNSLLDSHKNYSVYGVPRGGSCIAVAVSHMLNLPYATTIDSETLVVDDIYDSGATSKRLEQQGVPLENQFFWVKKESAPNEVQANIEADQNLWIVFPWEVDPDRDQKEYYGKLN